MSKDIEVIDHPKRDAVSEALLADIEAFLKKTGMSARAFSEAALGGSGRFVAKLRAGRSPRASTISACYAFMKGYRKGRK